MPYLENDNPRIQKSRMLKYIWRMYFDYGEVDDYEPLNFPERTRKYFSLEGSIEWLDRLILRDLFDGLFEKILSPRERKIIRMRFGFSTGCGCTYEEVGHYFGVTRERVRQLESKILQKLRESPLVREIFPEEYKERSHQLSAYAVRNR